MICDCYELYDNLPPDTRARLVELQGRAVRNHALEHLHAVIESLEGLKRQLVQYEVTGPRESDLLARIEQGLDWAHDMTERLDVGQR